MSSYDSIFDIFDNVLLADMPVFTETFPEPAVTESAPSVMCAPSDPIIEPIKPEEELQEEPEAPATTTYQGWALQNLREDIKPMQTLCFIKFCRAQPWYVVVA